MRNLVIQYYIDIQKYSQPEFNNLKPSPMEEYSRHSFKLYCEKFGLEYLRITEPKLGFKHPISNQDYQFESSIPEEFNPWSEFN